MKEWPHFLIAYLQGVKHDLVTEQQQHYKNYFKYFIFIDQTSHS